MKQEKGHSTKIQVTGCEAQANTSEVIAQQSFDSWVSAMEADYDRERTQRILDGLSAMREVARVKIEEARAARARAEGRENDWLERAVRSEMDLIESEREQRRMLWVEAGAEE